MTAPTPDTLRQIAYRLHTGAARPDDAILLEWIAMQWARLERALNEIVDDAMEQAQIAEAQEIARQEAMQSPVVVQFPSGQMRVRGGMA